MHPTFIHSGLSKGTYQTNKRNHFKEIRDRVCENIEIENVYTKFVVCAKEDILTSQGPFTREPTPIFAWVRVPTKLIRVFGLIMNNI